MRKFISWLLSAAAVSQVAAQARVCDADIVPMTANHFENPPPACAPGKYNGINVYTQGTPLLIRWVCTTSPVKLVIVQEKAANAVRTLVPNITTETSYQWDGYPPQPLANGATFFFGLYPLNGNTSTPLFFSDYINITASTAVSSSSSSSSSASSTSSTAASSTLQTSVTSRTSTASSSGSTATSTPVTTDTPSSSGKTIGIGVGVGVGVVALILIGLGALFMRRRSKRKQAAAGGVYGAPGGQGNMFQPGTGHAAYPNGYYDTSTKPELGSDVKPELSSETKPVGYYGRQNNNPAMTESFGPPQELSADPRR